LSFQDLDKEQQEAVRKWKETCFPISLDAHTSDKVNGVSYVGKFVEGLDNLSCGILGDFEGAKYFTDAWVNHKTHAVKKERYSKVEKTPNQREKEKEQQSKDDADLEAHLLAKCKLDWATAKRSNGNLKAILF
jgi:hypothetical protein